MNYNKLWIIIPGLLAASTLKAQNNDTLKEAKLTVVKLAAPGVQDRKTGASREILADFYQLALDDISGTNKGLTFSASLNAIHAGLHPGQSDFASSYFANNFQPVVKLGYKNDFKNLNASVGFKMAYNETDVKHSSVLNNNQALLEAVVNLQRKYQTVQKAFTKDLDDQYQAFLKTDSAKDKDLLAKKKKTIRDAGSALQQELTNFGKTGDLSALDPRLLALFKTQGIDVQELSLEYKTFATNLDAAVKKIALGWNISLSPLLIYDITHTGFQGFDLNLAGTKGWTWFNDNHPTSLIFKGAYTAGADTIVSQVSWGRKAITDQIGLNQVLASSIIQSVSKTDPTPWLELSITGGYNYVFSGLKPKENQKQPALNAKLGVLIGKSTWFTLPFTYNFGQKAATTLISVQVNIGDAPIAKN